MAYLCSGNWTAGLEYLADLLMVNGSKGYRIQNYKASAHLRCLFGGLIKHVCQVRQVLRMYMGRNDLSTVTHYHSSLQLWAHITLGHTL